MNLPRVACVLLGLGIGLLFYVAHRSDHTLSNRFVGHLCGPSVYVQLKQELKHWLPVPLALQGCLPSALWCFIVTSLSGAWKIRAGRERIIPLARLCPLINAGWEVVQWIGWTDGRADWRDAVAGFAGWMIAEVLLVRGARSAEISALASWRLGVALMGFACMGFADVWK